MSGNRMEDRWGLYIDIEGFSHRYSRNPSDALFSLGCLAGDLFKIGKYFTDPERLFIHQFGDGFLILSYFSKNSLNLPLSIAVSLMQSMLLRGREGGGVCRAGISTGDFADITGCLPTEITRDKSFRQRSVAIGDGLMTLIPVMGSALINPFKLQSKGPKGPLLFVDASLDRFLPSEGVSILRQSEEALQIDWVHCQLPMVEDLLGCLRGGTESLHVPAKLLEKQLTNYIHIHKNNVSDEWVSETQRLIAGK